MIYDQVRDCNYPLVCYLVPTQIQLIDHVSVLQKIAECHTVFISQALIFNNDHSWLVDSPAFYCRFEVGSYRCMFIKH